MSVKTVGVLAVQGAFIEHRRRLEELGIRAVELRGAADARLELDGLVLPGGESTVQSKLLRELDMYEALEGALAAGMPVFGTCAGLILLARRVENGSVSGVSGAAVTTSEVVVNGFATMPVTVVRNAYGRQLGGFHIDDGRFFPDDAGAGAGVTRAADAVEGLDASAAGDSTQTNAAVAEARHEGNRAGGETGAPASRNIPMTFIRAPHISHADEGVRVVAELPNGTSVAVRYENQIGATFHPELDDDLSIYELFARML